MTRISCRWNIAQPVLYVSRGLRSFRNMRAWVLWICSQLCTLITTVSAIVCGCTHWYVSHGIRRGGLRWESLLTRTATLALHVFEEVVVVLARPDPLATPASAPVACDATKHPFPPPIPSVSMLLVLLLLLLRGSISSPSSPLLLLATPLISRP